jgi:hypothetical protein
MSILRDIEKQKFTNELDYVMSPTIFADITTIENNGPHLETLDRAIKTKNIVKIDNDKNTNNIETILDRAEMYIPVDDDDVLFQAVLLDEARRGIHQHKIDELRDETLVTDGNKNIVQQKYFTSVKIKSDSQNVHETSVNKEMKKKYEIIKQKLKEHVGKLPDKNIKDDVRYTDNVRKIMRIESKWNNEREKDVYENVWKYISIQNNDDLVDSFFTAVEDCYENGNMVCGTGRANRIIGSLIMVDKNEELSKPVLTIDMVRKTALSDAYNIIQEELKQRGEEFTKLYNSEDFDDAGFKTDMLEKIKKNIVDKYGEIFTEKNITDLMTEISYGL